MATRTEPNKVKYKTEILKKCYFCGGEIIKKYSGIRDRFDTTPDTFSVSECEECKAAFLNPMVVGDVSSFYPTHYLSGEDQNQATDNKFDFEKWYRFNQYRYDFKLLKRNSGLSIKDAESYIDIGCGSGERVDFALTEGCKNAFGVDKFDFAKKKTKGESNIINSEIVKFKPAKKFQVASLFHVLEHVEKPDEILSHIRNSILQDNGYLIVQVPNYGSLERHIFKKRWFSFDVPRHLWQFNEKALMRMLKKNGYKIEATYKTNAPLHPVTIVPSISRELDIQRIWVKQSRGNLYKKFMTIVWAGLTVITIPLTIIQNFLQMSSMLTVIATKEK